MPASEWFTERQSVVLVSVTQTVHISTYLGDRIEGPLNAQDPLRVSRNRLGDVDTSVGLVLEQLGTPGQYLSTLVVAY